MPVTVSIPTALRRLTNDQPHVTVPAKTVGEVFAGLTKQYPEIKKHLFTDDGQLRNFVRVYVNDEDIHYLAGGKDAPLQEGDTVTIVPSIAGGREKHSGRNGGFR
jgi:molybdopterin converting factor small subunit